MVQRYGTADQLLKLSFEIGRALRRRFVLSHVGGTGVNFLQVHALMLLGEQPGMTMKELARLLNVAPPSATSFVDRLVRLGWVLRTHDRHNRKLVRLQVTRKGKGALQHHKEKKQLIVRTLIALLPVSDRRHLLRILRHLQKALHSSLLS